MSDESSGGIGSDGVFALGIGGGCLLALGIGAAVLLLGVLALYMICGNASFH